MKILLALLLITQLNLSSVECVDNTTVDYHFVLVQIPANITSYGLVEFDYTVDGVPGHAQAPMTRLVQGVAHYDYYEPWQTGWHTTEVVTGSVEIQVSGEPQTYYLHNPGLSYTLNCRPTSVTVLSLQARRAVAWLLGMLGR